MSSTRRDVVSTAPDIHLGVRKDQQFQHISAGRSRNYTQKYPPDPFGKEADDEARVWLVYLDEAESYDGDMIRGFKDTIDALLVLAGLFSVIVAVFLAQTSLNLKPNHAQLAVILLAEQVALLRLANGSPANTTTPRVDQNTLTFTKTDVLVNGLFFSSLALAMFTALLGVLVKQWLQAYNSQTSGSAKERALTRQFRFRGLQKWKVSQIVGFLPLLLHTSFAAFLSGLGVFVHDLHPSLTWVIVALSGLIFFVYFLSIFLPAIWLECPYRISILFPPAWLVVSMVRGTWNKLRSTFTSLGTEGSSEPFISFKSLKQAEKDLLAPSSSKAFDFGLRGHLVCSAVDWLWNLSGDTSIQEVIALTLHGFFWGSPSSPWLPINRSNVITYVSNFIPLHAILDTAFKRFFDSFKDDNTAGNARTWFSLFTILERDAQGIYSSWSRQNYWSSMIAPSSAQYVVKYAVRYGRLQFLTSVMQRDDVAELDKARARENEESFLHIASAAGHVDVVKLLLERGADIINGVERDDALVAAVMMGHLEIIKAFIAHHRVSSPAFFAALRKGNPDIVEAFLSGADLEKLDPNHEALQFACSQPEISLPIIRQLVFGGADLTRGGVQVLGGASYVGDLELVSHLIINRGVDPNTNDTSGVYDNALQAACDNNQLDVVQFLLDNGADPNGEILNHPRPLYYAARQNNLDIATILLEHGVDVRAVSEVGDIDGTALDVATSQGFEDMVRLLKEAEEALDSPVRTDISDAAGSHEVVYGEAS